MNLFESERFKRVEDIQEEMLFMLQVHEELLNEYAAITDQELEEAEETVRERTQQTLDEGIQ